MSKQKNPKSNKAVSEAKTAKETVKEVLKDLPIWSVIPVFIITTLIFFWQQLFGDAYFWEDFVEYVYPTQSFAASSSGIPFWNPYSFSGMPFMADLQVGFFYPLNRLLSLFVGSNGVLPVGAAQFVIILHFLIAQISMYFLTRYWKISSYGGIIAAISYAFSMILVCHVIHPMMIYHLAWFPLVLMFFIKGIELRSIKCSIWAGLLFGMTMLSGHPQTTLYEAFLLGIALVWYLVADLKSKKENMKLPVMVIAGIIPIIIAAGIFSIQMLPSQELAGLSQRDEITYEKSSEGSLQFKQVYSAVVPKLFGYVDGGGKMDAQFYLKFDDGFKVHYYWETAFYFGIVALILGLLGAVYMFRSRTGAFLTAIAVFGFLFALGDNGFLYKIFYNLPLFGSFRNPARLMFYVVLAFSVLAGFGFDVLWQKAKDRKFLIRLIIISAIPLLIAILTASGSLQGTFETPKQFVDAISGYGTTALLLILFTVVIAYITNKSIIKPFVGAALLIVICIIDLNMSGASFNESPVNPADKYQYDQRFVKDPAKFKPTLPDDLFRVSMRLYQPSFMAMTRNQGLLDRIMLVEGYNPLVLANVIPPLYSKLGKEDARQRYHDLLNVKYDIVIDQESGYPKFEERKTMMPRAWMVHKANVFKPDQVETIMKQQDFDFRNEVVLSDEHGLKLQGNIVPDDVVECLEYENNTIKYKTESTEDGILCFSEIYYPAWQAYIDGKPAKIIKSNYAYRAIPVPSGKHTVEMKYESASFATGMWVSIITLLASIAGLIFLPCSTKGACRK